LKSIGQQIVVHIAPKSASIDEDALDVQRMFSDRSSERAVTFTVASSALATPWPQPDLYCDLSDWHRGMWVRPIQPGKVVQAGISGVEIPWVASLFALLTWIGSSGCAGM
jgi:hypothetical protein